MRMSLANSGLAAGKSLEIVCALGLTLATFSAFPQISIEVTQAATAGETNAVPRHLDFVTRRGDRFLLEGKLYRVAGVNNHYLPWGSRQEVVRVLDDAVAMHANVVRTFVAPIIGSLDNTAPTIWDWRSKVDSSNLGVNGAYMAYWDPARHEMAVNTGPEGLQRIDFIIAEASKRKLRLIIAFLDYWSYTGGAPQMSAWRGGGGPDSPFFAENPQTRDDYKQLVRAVVTRVNGLTGVAYKDDPTIFAWELMNEPDIHPLPLLLAWVKEMAAYVKSLDPDHLLASGQGSVQTKLAELRIPDIDFGTWHGYPAYQGVAPETFSAQILHYCDAAKAYGKPVVLEEFGVARSNPTRAEIYRSWLATIQSNANCAGWLVWRLVARQDSNEYPADDHDQFDIHDDASPVWSVLKTAALSLTSAAGRRGIAADEQAR